MMLKVTTRLSRSVRPQLTRGSHWGSCGIQPWDDPMKNKRKSLNAPGWESFKLPADLVRPPCLPGGEQGKEQACVLESVGVYCIPHRIKYKYPPFSETMQAIPGSGKVCWWFEDAPCSSKHNDSDFGSQDKPDIKISM